MNLNPGIRKVVAFLNANGFETSDSGDGKTHDFECDREYAYVVAKVPPEQLAEEANRMRDLLVAEGVPLEAQGPEGTEPCIQADYDPMTGTAIIQLMNVDDATLASWGEELKARFP